MHDLDYIRAANENEIRARARAEKQNKANANEWERRARDFEQQAKDPNLAKGARCRLLRAAKLNREQALAEARA